MTTTDNFDGNKAEMIGMIPDQMWEKETKFSGHMFIENWFQPNPSVVDKTVSSTIGSSQEGNIFVRGYLPCYTVIETACVGAGGYETCYTSTYTACPSGGGGSGGGDTGTPGHGAGGGGGSSGTAVSNFILSKASQQMYPRFTLLVRSL